MATQVGNGQRRHPAAEPFEHRADERRFVARHQHVVGALPRRIDGYRRNCPPRRNSRKLPTVGWTSAYCGLPVLRQREGVRVEPLYSEQLLLAVPPNHALSPLPGTVDLAQLKDEAFISVPTPSAAG